MNQTVTWESVTAADPALILISLRVSVTGHQSC